MNPKVIPLKLFLDIVPSSSVDITHAMRGQPKRLSRNYERDTLESHCISVVISFHSRDVFCALAIFSFGRAFVVLCSFRCSLFGRLLGFKEFNLSKLYCCY